MIDTIKFKVQCSEATIEKIKKKSIYTLRTDLKSGEIKLEYYNTSIRVGSYSRCINIFFDEVRGDLIFFEFSLPKFVNGENVSLLDFQDISNAILVLHIALLDHFEEFPDPYTWEITRLDICYAWKFPSQQIAIDVLRSLKNYKYPRHKILNYQDSIYTYSENTTTKFYLKQPEFIKHDYKDISKDDLERAKDIYQEAEGVLRFEVGMKGKTISRKFKKKHIYINDINYDIILSLLQDYLHTFIKSENKEMLEESQVIARLQTYYKPQKALRLFSFYLMFHDDNFQHKDFLASLHRTTIQRNLKALEEAHIGLPYLNNSNYSISIPSLFAPQRRVTSVTHAQRNTLAMSDVGTNSPT